MPKHTDSQRADTEFGWVRSHATMEQMIRDAWTWDQEPGYHA